MKIGIIGAGNIGGTLAGKFVAAGHAVRIANSRGPDSLAEVARETGGTPSTIRDAVAADAVIIAIPYKAIGQLPADLFAGVPADVAIIDTGNYYPMRDGVIEALDGPLADTEWVARHFGRPVLKAFNSIRSIRCVRRVCRPALRRGSRCRFRGTMRGRSERPSAWWRMRASRRSMPAPFAESWRQQPGTGAYTTDLDEHLLRKALDSLTSEDRARQPERRESNLKMILALKQGPGSAESVRALRAQWGLPE